MIIYLDLDGVLVDCHMAALQEHHLFLDEYPRGKRVKDILDAAHRKTPNSYNEFWADFDESFWANLSPTDECNYIIQYAMDLAGPDNVFISTRPTTNPGSAAGKMCWIKKYLPAWIHEQVFIGRYKYLLARRDALLLDDNPGTCNSFREHGGQSILIERPWNGHDDMDMTKLRTAMWAADETMPPSFAHPDTSWGE